MITCGIASFVTLTLPSSAAQPTRYSPPQVPMFASDAVNTVHPDAKRKRGYSPPTFQQPPHLLIESSPTHKPKPAESTTPENMPMSSIPQLSLGKTIKVTSPSPTNSSDSDIEERYSCAHSLRNTPIVVIIAIHPCISKNIDLTHIDRAAC